LEQLAISHETALAMADEELDNLLCQYQKKQRIFSTDERYIDFQGRVEYFQKELTRTGVTRHLLWEEYRQQNPEGYGFTQFCEYIKVREQQNSVVMHLEHKAGEKMFVDFAGKKLHYTDRGTGEVIPCEVFVATLGCSSYVYAEAIESQKMEPFIGVLGNTLFFFGGVPQCIIPDNFKSAVIRANRYEPDINSCLERFALHYKTAVMPARSGKPRDKAQVEATVRFLYQRVYARMRDQVYHSLPELNAAIHKHLTVFNNTLMQGRDYSRYSYFLEMEQSSLQPLPSKPFAFYHTARFKVQKNYHVMLGIDKHYYSVPYEFVGKQVSVIYTREEVEIYYEYKRIAFHQRLIGKYHYSTIAEHMPESHRVIADQQRQWSPDYFLNWASSIGTNTHEAISQLLTSRQYMQQSYQGCLGILRLASKYDKPRLELACGRALLYKQVSYKVVCNILSRGMDLYAPKKAAPTLFELPKHENVRGSSNYF
jgi:transposase